jgi:hypothetical protein
MSVFPPSRFLHRLAAALPVVAVAPVGAETSGYWLVGANEDVRPAGGAAANGSARPQRIAASWSSGSLARSGPRARYG